MSALSVLLPGASPNVIFMQAGILKKEMDALTPAIYIMANESNDILYIGVTQDLIKRVWQHKNDIFPGFTRKYHVHRLVYYEFHEAFESAIMRGKQLKKWNRRKKIELIEKENPRWDELWEEIYRNDGL